METVFAHAGQLMVVHGEQQRVRQRRQAPLHQEPRPADWHPIIQDVEAALWPPSLPSS